MIWLPILRSAYLLDHPSRQRTEHASGAPSGAGSRFIPALLRKGTRRMIIPLRHGRRTCCPNFTTIVRSGSAYNTAPAGSIRRAGEYIAGTPGPGFPLGKYGGQRHFTRHLSGVSGEKLTLWQRGRKAIVIRPRSQDEGSKVKLEEAMSRRTHRHGDTRAALCPNRGYGGNGEWARRHGVRYRWDRWISSLP